MSAVAREPQPVRYPAEDDVGETVLHLLIRTLLLELVRRWFASRGVFAFVGSDQFVYWAEGNPQRSVAPDLYVLYGVAPDRLFPSWKVWEEGVVPRLAVEVVSEEPYKDYVLAPRRYAELGVDELVIFDPLATGGGGERVRWQVYRRRGEDLLLEARHDGDRVESTVLGCWLLCVQDRGQPRVRLGTGPTGDDLVPTADEEKDAERHEKEAERARRLALESELERLRRRLREP